MKTFSIYFLLAGILYAVFNLELAAGGALDDKCAKECADKKDPRWCVEVGGHRTFNISRCEYFCVDWESSEFKFNFQNFVTFT